MMTRSLRARRPSYKILENADSGGSWNRHRGRWSGKTARVEVVVPTLQQIHALPAGSEAHMPAIREHDSQERPSPQTKSEAEDAKMHFLLQERNDVQIKSEEIISENDVRYRLALLGYHPFDVKVPRDILEVTTTRNVTTRIWGGNMRATFPKIGKEFTHGLDDFMYISLQYDPHAPRWPGSPGVVFRFRDDGEEWPKIMRLIVRLRKNIWQYMGQYKLTAAPPLTPNEWNAQSLTVRRKCATRLSERKSDGGLKAKLVLRKRLGRDPTPEEVAIAVKSKEKFNVSEDEILQACDKGQVVVHVWCMKCVGFDVEFQRRIAAGS